MSPTAQGFDPTRHFLDVFLSHASEDRADVARPLAGALVALGYSVWISDEEVVVGNALPLKINEGLRSCRFGVTVLSPPYLQKHWTMRELSALTSREEVEAREIIIPVLHNIDRARLTAELPLWAPAVSVTWNGDAGAVATALARAIGRPVTDAQPRQDAAFAFATALSSGELNLGPRHDALVKGAGEVVAAINDVWRVVQASNTGMPKGASDVRKRAHGMMLAGALKAPSAVVHTRTDALETAAAEYTNTLRRLLEFAEVAPSLDKSSLVTLNEVYGGAVAATFEQMASLFTDKRVQAITFPRRHPSLTLILDRVGEDLGRLSYAFETLVDFCLSEMPARIRRILER
ncbi:MAG: toll/interleukin-1 receptor domain-containing protein [Vicinamibacterales bacterium]